jgi:transposase InsO family protein
LRTDCSQQRLSKQRNPSECCGYEQTVAVLGKTAIAHFSEAEHALTTRPDEAWMPQVGRNLTDCESGALRAKQYLIIDRDSKYTAQFRRLIRDNGTKVIRLAPRLPSLNAYAERFVRSIKDECLNRMIVVARASLRRASRSFQPDSARGGKLQCMLNSEFNKRSLLTHRVDAVTCEPSGALPISSRRI